MAETRKLAEILAADVVGFSRLARNSAMPFAKESSPDIVRHCCMGLLRERVEACMVPLKRG
jgi:hypothetical protein